MQKVVIIPTYNECGNIEKLVHTIFDLRLDTDILVVDDNSPDGTGEIVQRLQKKLYRLHLLSGEGKRGLARAYLEGFKWALSRNYDVIVQMDADFSHRPQDLAPIFDALQTADVVVGSRYVPGGGTANWSWLRQFISRGASHYSRWILGYPLADWTGGFNGWRGQVLNNLDLDRMTSEGYCFQIEMKYRAKQKGFNIIEVPILFEDRRVGQSKMSFRIVVEALYRVWGIRLSRLKGSDGF